MDLLEYEGIALFKKYGIHTPKGCVFSSLKEMKRCDSCSHCADTVIKAQIPSGKRGKSGGIVFTTKGDLKRASKRLLSKKIRGFDVDQILVEEKVEFDKELYLSLTVSRQDRAIVALFSEQGGIDIEELAEKNPKKIIKAIIDEKTEDPIRLKDKRLQKQVNSMINRLLKLMKENDATLVEINPLALHYDHLIALDSKITIDDNALYRHELLNRPHDKTKIEAKAAKEGIQYIELDGNIGVIGNGAGLVMATLDVLDNYRGKAANFLDVGGGADHTIMFKSMDLCLMNRKVKGLMINIFGGITRCDEVAKGIIDYKKKNKLSRPVVARLIGTNEKEARAILKKEVIEMHDSMETCAKSIIKLTR